MTYSNREWALRLYRKSVLKQAKFKRFSRALGDVNGKRCLDIGADNGVLSLLFRQLGGSWASADLDPETVEAIRSLVATDVHLIDGEKTPFGDAEFDVVAIVDFLEHVRTDAEFTRECARIIKPGGTLIVNVPCVRRWSVLEPLKRKLGLTDEEHGHVREGYTLDGLRALLALHFEVTSARTYNRFFSECVDVAVRFASRKKKGGRTGAKGTVMTASDLAASKKALRLYSLLYPFFWLLARLDVLVPARGMHMIVSGRRK
ncbi:MAG: class I SAM-dependent methyltransferase [Verrucomicrobia bacterium]|nr:class I SAM-dependent methyltransferase [Verrucomicrobiota bacterium]